MKLWKIEIERTVMVMADCEEQALQRARRYEANDAAFNDPDSIRALVVTTLQQVPLEQHGCIPYFAAHDHSCERIVREQDTSNCRTTEKT